MIISTTYGVGGYDETKPNNNIVEVVERINADECVVRKYEGDTVVSETTVPMPEVAQLPEQIKRQQELIDEAREAVSGYAPNNGARKAVEALANALEQTQSQSLG